MGAIYFWTLLGHNQMKKEFLYSFEWFFKELESINLLHTRQVEKKVTIYSRWPYSHKRKYFIQENIPELQCSDKHHLQQESGISNKTIKYKLNIKYSNSNLSVLVEYFVEWCWISWLMYRVKFWILPTHHFSYLSRWLQHLLQKRIKYTTGTFTWLAFM